MSASQERMQDGAGQTTPTAALPLPPPRRLSANPFETSAPLNAKGLAVEVDTDKEPRVPAAAVTSHRAPRPASAGLPPRSPAPTPVAVVCAPSAQVDNIRPEVDSTGSSEKAPAVSAVPVSHIAHQPEVEAHAEKKIGEQRTEKAEDAHGKATDTEASVPPQLKEPLLEMCGVDVPATEVVTPPSPHGNSSFAQQYNTLMVPIPVELDQDGNTGPAARARSAKPTTQPEAAASANDQHSTEMVVTTKPSVAPIDDKARFRHLFLGILVMLMSSTVGTFSIFGFYIQKAYAYTPDDMMDLFVIGTSCGLAATFLSGALYDLYAQRVLVVLMGILIVVPACVLLGLSFHRDLKGTKAQFIGFFFLLNVGAYGLDLTAMITTVTHFPRNRGMVCGLLKTFSGLGASFYSCLYRGYLYNKVTAKNFSNLFFFLTVFIFVLGVVCAIFFQPAPWADVRFFRYARRRRAAHRMWGSCHCLDRLFLGEAAKSSKEDPDDSDDDDAFMTPKKVEEHLREYFVAKVPYLKYRPPQRRIRITFIILLLINVFMTVQLVLVAYLEITSRAALNGIATGALILVLLTSVLAWPLDCLDGEVDYARAEQDINGDGIPIGPAEMDGIRIESARSDEGEDVSSPTAPVVLKPAAVENPLAHPPVGGVKTSQETSGSFSPHDSAHRRQMAEHGGGVSLLASHRTSDNFSFSLPPSHNNRGTAGGKASFRRRSSSPRMENVAERCRDRDGAAVATYPHGTVTSLPHPLRTCETPRPSRTWADRSRQAMDTTGTLSHLLFAREVTEAVSMLEPSASLRSPRERDMTELTETIGVPPTHTSRPPLSHVSSPLTQSRRSSHRECDAPVPLSASSTFSRVSAIDDDEIAGEGEAQQRGLSRLDDTRHRDDGVDALMQTILVERSKANHRIPVNGDTVIELLKYRSGFPKALLTPEFWVLLWISFTVWATGLTITSNLFIQLFFAAEDGQAMSNKLYYLFAALSGIAVAGGRVAIGTVADDLLPALRRKYHRPFGIPFTLLLVFPPWALVLGLFFFMAIPGATVQILGHLCVAFAYGLTTSAVPYALTVFFSFEYVGLGKMYGLCLLAVGAGVAVLYRAAFALTYRKKAFPVGVPGIPPAAWGMCLKGKTPCTLDFLIVCLVLNVVAGFAAVYLHLRFCSRLHTAAGEQIAIVEAQVPHADVDVAYLHEWVREDPAGRDA